MFRRNGFAPILIIVIVAIAAALGGWYYVKKYSVPAQNNVAGPQPPASSSTDQADTSNWKTYRNKQYGFEFKYPSGWKIKDIGDGNVGFFPPGKSIDLYEYNGDIILNVLSNPNQWDLKTFYGQSRDGDLFKQSEKQTPITIDQHEAEKFTNVYGMIPTNTVSINKSKVIIELSDIGQMDVDNGIFDKILSTFKFLK